MWWYDMTVVDGSVRWTVVKYSRVLLIVSLLLALLLVAGSGDVAAQHGDGIVTACGAEAHHSGMCDQDFSTHPGYVNGNHG
jgi:hypothetical protein